MTLKMVGANYMGCFEKSPESAWFAVLLPIFSDLCFLVTNALK